MTVVVNAVAAKMGGAATYLRALVRELAAAPEAGRFVVYVPPEQAELGRGAPPHIEWRVSAAGHAGALRRFWWDQVTLRRLVRRERADVLYSTANFALLFCPVPQVLLVRQALYFSPLYASVVLRRKSRRFRLAHWLRRQLVQLSIRHATTVLAPSRSLQDQMRAAGASRRARVEVLPYGAQAFNHSRANPGTAPKHERPLRLLLADLYAEHKNLGTVLDAMKRVRERNGLAVQLTTTADPDWKPAGATVTAAADRARLRDPALAGCVRLLPPGSPDTLAQLYDACDVVLHPTLAESFGHSLLAALAAGRPVVASDIPINRELAGEAALYFAPLDADELAEAILRLAREPALRARLAAAGQERARGYTWAAHVARLRALLAEAANEGR